MSKLVGIKLPNAEYEDWLARATEVNLSVPLWVRSMVNHPNCRFESDPGPRPGQVAGAASAEYPQPGSIRECSICGKEYDSDVFAVCPHSHTANRAVK